MSVNYQTAYEPKTLFQKLRRAAANALGRERANRLSAPFHDWLARRRTRACLQALPASGLLVNLGCGYRPLRGWVNVDAARGPQVDVVWDLRQGLPFAAASCAAIFCEHVIEHLTKADGERLLRECSRVLQPGGVLRLSTPDAGRFLRSYAGDQAFLYHPGFTEPIETPLDRINQMMREYGQHLWVYDAASLRAAMRRAGFAATAERAFGESPHAAVRGVDSPDRAFESLYVEAVNGE
jgi:predicted SAM-dependent methyltransferase